jgi:DNA-binding SARP family transcriptional activator
VPHPHIPFASHPRSVIRLHVLGSRSATSDGATSDGATSDGATSDGATDIADLLAQPKAVALLVYLAAARPLGYHQRDRIVGLFWPAIDQEHARASLRKLLHRLRQTVGADVIDSRGTESIGLRTDALWCDAVAFETALSEDRLREALDLFQGDLLPGFFIPGAGEFDRWLDEARSYYRERAVNAAWELVQRYAQDAELTNASQLARVVARLAPTDERMLRRVMTMVWKLGDRAGAMDVFSRFTDRLWKDLETRPSAETMRLVEQIQGAAPFAT